MRDLFVHINAIGVELEGGWDEFPCDCHELHGDGSVQVQANRKGEIPIGPFYAWSQAEREIASHYPNHVNASCGLHVHLSFPTPGHYSALMSARFESYLIRRLKLYGVRRGFSEDGTYMSRLRGRNRYCAYRYSDTRSMSQARSTYRGDDRYAMVNYCHALHGTIEVRVLPAFKRPRSAVKAIRFLVDSFNRYLSLPGALVPHVETAASDAVIEQADADLTLTVDAGPSGTSYVCEVA